VISSRIEITVLIDGRSGGPYSRFYPKDQGEGIGVADSRLQVNKPLPADVTFGGDHGLRTTVVHVSERLKECHGK
jgi:hypothetical protein